MRERLLRWFRWEAAGRMPGRGNFLFVEEAQIVIESGGLEPENHRDFLLDFVDSVSSATERACPDIVEDHHAFLHDRWNLTGSSLQKLCNRL